MGWPGDTHGHGEALNDWFLLSTLALCSRLGCVPLSHGPGASVASHRDPMELAHVVLTTGTREVVGPTGVYSAVGSEGLPVGVLLTDSTCPMSLQPVSSCRGVGQGEGEIRAGRPKGHVANGQKQCPLSLRGGDLSGAQGGSPAIR